MRILAHSGKPPALKLDQRELELLNKCQRFVETAAKHWGGKAFAEADEALKRLLESLAAPEKINAI